MKLTNRWKLREREKETREKEMRNKKAHFDNIQNEL